MPASELVTQFIVGGASKLLSSLNSGTKAQKKYHEAAEDGAFGTWNAQNKLVESYKQLVREAKNYAKNQKGVNNWQSKIKAGFVNNASALKNYTMEFTKFGKSINMALAKIETFIPRVGTMGKKLKFALGAGLAAAAAAATAAIGLTVVTLRSLVAGLKRGWEAAKKFQKTYAIMETTFTDLNKSANQISMDKAIEQMEKLYETTLFTKEEILRAQAAIGRTTRDPEVFERATQAALDLVAARPEMSVSAASQFLTTLLGDPSRTVDKLRRVEIQVSKTYQEAMERMVKAGRMREAQLLTIDQLTKRFAGSAVKAAGTAAGTIEDLSRRTQDIYQKASGIFAEKLAPAFAEATQVLIDNREEIINVFKASAQWAAKIAGYASKAAKTFAPLLPYIEKGLTATGMGNLGKAKDDSYFGDYMGALGGLFTRNPLEQLAEQYTFYSGGYKNKGTVGGETTREEDIQYAKEVQQRKEAAAMEQYLAEQRILGITSVEERAQAWEERQKKMLAERKKAQEEYARSVKRLQQHFRNTETAQEQYMRQMSQIQDVWRRATQTGNANAGLYNQLTELQKRLYKELMTELNKPRVEAAKKAADEAKKKQEELNAIADKYDPLTPMKRLREEFIRVSKEMAPSKRRTAILRGIQGEMAGLLPEKAQKSRAFSPITTSIDSLYKSIETSVLTKKDDPTTKAVKQVNKTLERNARRHAQNMQKYIDAQPPAVK